jgi:hypothetical protein
VERSSIWIIPSELLQKLVTVRVLEEELPKRP